MLTAHSGANTPNGSAPPGRASGGASGGKTNTAARLVETLDLSPALRVKLVNAGFRTVEDLEHMTPAGLVQELEITMDEALSIVRQYNQAPIPSTSALDLLERDLRRRPITTFCAALDGILDPKGAGVQSGVVTEFCGEPGVGKTQLCMQLCINVQIPKSIGGVGGEALYIDSEGSFVVDRLAQIAEGTIAEMNPRLLQRGLGDDMMKLDDVLERIHYFRVRDYVEQMAVTHLLNETLDEHPNIKLIVIDSVAFHFRQHFNDMALRTRLLINMANTCMALTTKREIAVVMINQMTTKLGGKMEDGQSQYGHLIPALGESWGHCSTHRIILSYDHGGRSRKAAITKSPSLQQRSVYYDVTPDGIRDVQEAQRRDLEGGDSSADPRKRPRID